MEQIDRLPASYATALRLRAQGLATDVIAETLGVPPEAVGPLLELAEAKLAGLEAPHGTEG